ncbi:MAG: gas vesicle protein K [Labilithrix sp.]|nr:gas vesicle protein K [Labilithrix sp.]
MKTVKKRAAVKAAPRRKGGVAALRVREIEALRREVEAHGASLARWSPDPEDVQKSVAQLVLALVEFLRKLLERQAIRRMEAETLTPEEIERIGVALMRLEETVHDLARRFGLDPEELNLDLGPLGRLS